MNDKNTNTIEDIIENARWAPSGDNMQTWCFEVINPNHFVVHGHDTREHCVYDLQGHASQLALGTLVENIAISASYFGYNADFHLHENKPETNPTIDVNLTEDTAIEPDSLFPYLPIRSVQRRALKTTSLNTEQKMALQQAVGNLYTLQWIEGWQSRWQAALLMFKNGKLRLTLPEAFLTHSTVIEWNSRFSYDKIPDQAVGLDSMTTRLMQWTMKSWKRVSFLNTYFAGTVLPRIELDLVPGLCCAAHFALIAKEKPASVQDYLIAGRALQRFWLTATQLDLQLQPEMTPLIFSGYVREKLEFTKETALITYAEELSNRLTNLLGETDLAKVVFLGRIGRGKPAYARSLRLPVKELIRTFS
jgi:nitroreductase